MRGEHDPFEATDGTTTGSPPHARGAPSPIHTHPDTNRITPACAGSTGATTIRPSSQPDHPRMRGEHDHYISEALQ